MKKSLESITSENAEDILKDFFWSRDVKLRRQKLKYFMSDMTYHNYTEAYQLNHGSLPYNNSYDKKTLEGASNVELVPLANVPDDFLLLTPKSNIMALFNQKSDDEKYLVEKSLDNHYDVDFIANMFFGTQFLSVSKESFSSLGKNRRIIKKMKLWQTNVLIKKHCMLTLTSAKGRSHCQVYAHMYTELQRGTS